MQQLSKGIDLYKEEMLRIMKNSDNLNQYIKDLEKSQYPNHTYKRVKIRQLIDFIRELLNLCQVKYLEFEKANDPSSYSMTEWFQSEIIT